MWFFYIFGGLPFYIYQIQDRHTPLKLAGITTYFFQIKSVVSLNQAKVRKRNIFSLQNLNEIMMNYFFTFDNKMIFENQNYA